MTFHKISIHSFHKNHYTVLHEYIDFLAIALLFLKSPLNCTKIVRFPGVLLQYLHRLVQCSHSSAGIFLAPRSGASESSRGPACAFCRRPWAWTPWSDTLRREVVWRDRSILTPDRFQLGSETERLFRPRASLEWIQCWCSLPEEKKEFIHFN